MMEKHGGYMPAADCICDSTEKHIDYADTMFPHVLEAVREWVEKEFNLKAYFDEELAKIAANDRQREYEVLIGNKGE